ncbi:type I restriction endonuclease subunit R, partial [Thiolapillus sp.]|uniref:type I restriction endonuclease subunit R n=4 Tax=Thiolapillus sp. TaxID=2017437 RepID=UPI0025D8B869
AIHELLTLGMALEQTVEGDTRSTETARPDIVLFVNGIPFAVIECKSPKVEVEQAISQSIRNQRDEYVPKLFIYTQIVLGVNKNAARYATVGTPAKFWSLWKERQDKEAAMAQSIHRTLPDETKDALFSGEFATARRFFDTLEAEGVREITEQDRAIYSLCRPERLLELVYKFTVFDGGIKKIARYQQYFAIQRILTHVKQRDTEGRRRGGIVWHTQGSGKSLTMVMLARALAQEPDIHNPRIVLVTDRKDLDKQLKETFAACDMAPQRARTGRDLLELVSDKKADLVTTLVHKFDKALNVKKYRDESPDIFMLIDESHRTQFGNFAARMRQMFPNACYLGFTGTPLMKKEKNNFAKFGGLIDKYAIDQAVADGAIVPLLYEGRHVEMEQNEKAIDLWFSRHTQGLTDAQRADLKKKYARAEMLNKTDQVIYMRAFDISEHFRANWQGTGYKAQLVAPSKAAALKYHHYLEELGFVSSEVIISGPDSREGYDDVDDEPADEIVRFWQKMMKRYGSEEEYNKQIINRFKYGDEPEILIVVDKLLTGFDAPRNTVLYLTRILREHTLLQAIARVNRIYENEDGASKEFGYIVDYASVLGELDRALSMYSVLDGFEDEDLAGTLIAVQEEVAKLPQRYSNLWDLFNEVKNQYDEEAYEKLLADDALREEFYERLAQYSKALGIALSVEKFVMNTPEEKLRQYKDDLKRFQNLKASVKIRYAEAIDYRDYEPKIRKLLDTHISASEVIQINEPVNIFDEETFSQVKEEHGIYGAKTTAAKADTIAHATKKAITEKMEEDPAFYEKFSKLIQQAIDDFKAKRLSDLEYLQQVSEIRDKIVNREHDNVPQALQGNDDAMAFYGILKPYFEASDEGTACAAALAIGNIIRHHWKVHFWDDLDAQKQAMNDIDDYLYDEVKGERGIDLGTKQMDEIIEKSMQLARHRIF